MKTRKFALGGNVLDYPKDNMPDFPTMPIEPPMPNPIPPPPGKGRGGFGGNTAYGGLEQVGAGAKTVGSALDDISNRLGKGTSSGSGISPGMTPMMKKGGKVKGYAQGGSVGSASKRADGCAQRGKTKGRMV